MSYVELRKFARSFQTATDRARREGNVERANERAINYARWMLRADARLAACNAEIVNGLPINAKERRAYAPDKPCQVKFWRSGKLIASVTLPPHARPVKDAMEFWNEREV